MILAGKGGLAMKAAFLTGTKRLEVREIPRPKPPRGGDVLLRVQTVGICGSDVHYFREGRIGTAVVEFPWVPGHEFSATVVETGPDVRNIKPLDRVAVDPLIVCGRCDQCTAGREHLCRRQRFLGCPGEEPGALVEYIIMPEECCYPIPDSMTFEEATLAEPLSIAMHSCNLADAKAGEVAAVLGCGPVGLSVLLTLKHRGVESVYVTDLLDERLSLAEKSGATWTGNAAGSDVVDAMLAAQPADFDCVLECAGEQETLDQAAMLLKPAGRLAMVGIPRENRVGFDISMLRRKEIVLKNVRRQNRCVQAAIDAIASGGINVAPLVTHRFGLDDVHEAFELVSDYRDGVVKAMVHVAD